MQFPLSFDRGVSQASSFTLQQVQDHVRGRKDLSSSTRESYLQAVERCRKIYNLLQLSDVVLELEAFERRWTKELFPHDHFKTPQAYRKWRGRMVDLIKQAQGLPSPWRSKQDRLQNDDWDKIRALGRTGPLHPKRLLSLNALVRMARTEAISPKDLSQDWLDQRWHAASGHERTALARGVKVLTELRACVEQINTLLPYETLVSPARVLRSPPLDLPNKVHAAFEGMVEEICKGEIDEVTGEFVQGLKETTRDTYRAGFKKYLHKALQLQLVEDETFTWGQALSKPVFLAVLNAFTQDEAMAPRTLWSYVLQLKKAAAIAGVDAAHIQKALELNHRLLDGKRRALSMAEVNTEFCKRLVREKPLAHLFRRLHLRFQEKARVLLKKAEKQKLSMVEETRLQHLGVLAAYSALSLYYRPFRISEMRSFCHLGPEPNLRFYDKRQRIGWCLKPEETKNKRLNEGSVEGNPHRAFEVILWYRDVIRPRMGGVKTSLYFFPSPSGRAMSDEVLRNALWTHSYELGIPMTPHQFRHGQASLYLHHNPGCFMEAAILLNDEETTVRQSYAFVDKAKVLERVQEQVLADSRLRARR